MNETKIVIDAGHGGSDPGASGNGIIEKNLNLEISKYMYNRFKELGIPVTLIRDNDETISPTQRVDRILNAYGNDPNVIVISNHINAGGGEGAEVIYALRNNSTLANLILENIKDEGQVVREVYQRRLPSNPSKDYYFIHRDTGVTQPVIVEYGFLDNTNDANRLKANYQKYAEAVVKSIVEYLNLSYDKKDNENIYTVKSGDSLWSISKQFNLSVEELKSANNLTSNLLSVGQKLIIPIDQEPQTGEYTIYIVKKGDNLYSIANRYNTTVNELIEYNNLSSSNLQIGDQILIPNIPQQEVEEEFINYKVASGDNLYSIARKYDTTVNEIKALNNLTSNLLNVGQILRIPKTMTGTYIVKSGDNLYSIARKYNTTVDDIKRKNNLTSNLLNIGQVLII